MLAFRPPSGDETAAILEQVAYFRLRGVNSFTWWLEVGLSEDDWSAQLLPHGFEMNHYPPGKVTHFQYKITEQIQE